MLLTLGVEERGDESIILLFYISYTNKDSCSNNNNKDKKELERKEKTAVANL